MNQETIRNFSIIAHIDHGKSTLADRVLEIAAITDQRTKKEQILDSMDIERERGITIKSNSASFDYQSKNGKNYRFNLIDTPGHVDFTYEVTRSLVACEGVLLLIDATQGIQAQTIANFYLALETDLMILPVINKIDLPSANIDKVRKQIEDSLGLSGDEALPVSAKTGEGISELMEAIIHRIPAPSGNLRDPLRAIVFDAYFDPYRGVVEKVRVVDGIISKGDSVCFMQSSSSHIVSELGISQINLLPQNDLKTGEVGYIVTGIKNIADVNLGDTITHEKRPAEKPLFAYKEPKPMVFSGLYPVNGEEYQELKEAMEKLALNDPALAFELESSNALGFGYRVGYLGLLHLEIIQERLEREYNLELISTAPSVSYHIILNNNKKVVIDNPSKMPDPSKIIRIEEPYVKINIIAPKEYVGGILKLLNKKRGENIGMEYLDTQTVQIIYLIPLSEMIFEFYDKLKSISKGYATMDYEFFEYRSSDLVKMDILVHSNKVDALSIITHRNEAAYRGREILKQLRGIIQRHQFQIALQASIGSNIIARENIAALRKNVTAKCYGGDITRKRKLLEKQKAGKRRMKMVGNVEVPQEAFLAVLKSTSDDL